MPFIGTKDPFHLSVSGTAAPRGTTDCDARGQDAIQGSFALKSEAQDDRLTGNIAPAPISFVFFNPKSKIANPKCRARSVARGSDNVSS